MLGSDGDQDKGVHRRTAQSRGRDAHDADDEVRWRTEPQNRICSRCQWHGRTEWSGGTGGGRTKPAQPVNFPAKGSPKAKRRTAKRPRSMIQPAVRLRSRTSMPANGPLTLETLGRTGRPQQAQVSVQTDAKNRWHQSKMGRIPRQRLGVVKTRDGRRPSDTGMDLRSDGRR